MFPSSGLLYLGSNSVQPSAYRLTVTPCTFDEYAILIRDGGGWWIYDEDAKAVQITNKVSAAELERAQHRELSSSGDEETTRFFTIPKEFRYGGEVATNSEEIADSKTHPEEVQFDHKTNLHFVSATMLVSDDRRSLYLFTLDQLENKVTEPDMWANDARSINRLMNSEASHLFDDRMLESGVKSISIPDRIESSRIHTGLEDCLETQNDRVSDEFEAVSIVVWFEDIPQSVYSSIDLKYLLVRYREDESYMQNPTEDTETITVFNRVVDFETSYSQQDQVIEAEVPFCIHEHLIAEFKFFAEVASSDQLEIVQPAFSDSPSCDSATISGSVEDRVYMVHSDFRTIQSAGGFINNEIRPD